MKILHIGLVLAFVLVILSYTRPVHAYDGIEITNLQVIPDTITVGDTFAINATLSNNSPYPIYIISGVCTVPFDVIFDDHAKQDDSQVSCKAMAILEKIDPQNQATETSAKPGTVFVAQKAGLANATVVFSYHIPNQTDSSQPGVDKKIYKSFQFVIHDKSEKPPAYFGPPLQQFNAGVSSSNIKCKQDFFLVIKSENNLPACTTPSTAFRLLALGWGYLPSPFITKIDLLNSKISGGEIKEFQYDAKNRIILIKIQTVSDGSLIVTIPKIITDLNPSDKPFKDFHTVLVDGREVNVNLVPTTNGSSITIPFTNGAQEIEIIGNQVGQQS